MKNKILIIDDSEEILFAISEFFKFKEWEVYTAQDVEEALGIVISESKLDIIIIDYNMPHINGAMGVRLIRQVRKDIPIIALTIEGRQDIADDFFASGADDFAIKPIKVLDLYSRIQVHLGKNKINDMKIEYPKGINGNTIELIKEAMVELDEYITVEAISDLTGLAPKTINRYMNYLLENKDIEIKVIYGKVGRPKNEYIWMEKEKKEKNKK